MPFLSTWCRMFGVSSDSRLIAWTMSLNRLSIAAWSRLKGNRFNEYPYYLRQRHSFILLCGKQSHEQDGLNQNSCAISCLPCKARLLLYGLIRNCSLLLRFIHLGALPRPDQVSPVAGLRYFAARAGRVLTFIFFPLMPRSDAVIPYSVINALI